MLSENYAEDNKWRYFNWHLIITKKTLNTWTLYSRTWYMHREPWNYGKHSETWTLCWNFQMWAEAFRGIDELLTYANLSGIANQEQRGWQKFPRSLPGGHRTRRLRRFRNRMSLSCRPSQTKTETKMWYLGAVTSKRALVTMWATTTCWSFLEPRKRANKGPAQPYRVQFDWFDT